MTTLESILSSTSVPHHPFILVQHSLSTIDRPLLTELLARGSTRGPTLLITSTRPPEYFLPSWQSSGGRAVDLSASIPGFGDEVDVTAKVKEACANMPAGFQVFVEAADVIAEDYSPAVAIRIVKMLLNAVKESKPPARLIISSLTTHPLTQDLMSATLSPSLTLLTVHNPQFIEHQSRAYLLPSDPSDTSDPSFLKYFQLLESATRHSTADTLALNGVEADIQPLEMDKIAIQILIRKPTGGAKALIRTLEGLEKSSSSGTERWTPKPLDAILNTRPPVAPSDTKRATTHADLDLPFNLRLTDSQKAARSAVPLPYAHEGEGADLGMGMDWSDDEEDDEV